MAGQLRLRKSGEKQIYSRFTNIIIMDIAEQSGKNSVMNLVMKSIFQKFIPLPAG